MKLDENGDWRMLDSPQGDGSRFKDTRDAAVEIANRLRKDDVEGAEVDRILSEFAAGNEVRVGQDTFRPRTGDLTIELDVGAGGCGAGNREERAELGG